MKRFLGLFLAVLLFPSSALFAAVVEDWSGIAPGNTGTYQDSNGSKIEFVADAGPKGGQKALKITANKVGSGYCGVYHNVTLDLSKSASFKFMAKSTVAGDIQMAIVDAFGVQYVAKFPVTTAWAEVNVPFASFIKDPYYTPPAAVLGHPMDLSKDSNLNFSPQMDGASVVLIGPVESAGTGTPAAASTGAAKPAAAAAPAAAAPAASGAGLSKPLMIQDFADFDMKSAGTFQDSQGSSIEFGLKDKKGGKMLTVTYSLKGDYCGLWVRAGGNDWKGAKTTGANTLYLKVYSKTPLTLGLAVLENTNNQYAVDAPALQGGKWETIAIPFSSFSLDKYYTPPAAIKGAPMDFSLIHQFNLQPKTKGEKVTFAVDSVWVK